MNTLTTARLVLEPQVAAHAEALFAVLGDPAIYEFENAPPRSLEWLRERYAFLERRASHDGSEQWLNWIVRIVSSEPIGYVQATITREGRAGIAYEFASAHWGQGYASEAVTAMIGELASHYGVHTLTAVLKVANHRSLRLLERLGFAPGTPELAHALEVESDERCMVRAALA